MSPTWHQHLQLLVDAAPVALIDRFVQCERGEVSLNAITWVELCCGMDAQNSRDETMVLFSNPSPRNFSMDAAVVFGKLSQQFLSRKNSFDRMVASTYHFA